MNSRNMTTEKPHHLRLEKVQKMAGFVSKDAIAGERVEVLTRAFIHSDQKEFYDYINHISSVLLARNFSIDNVNSFLVLIHKDLTADIYVNHIPLVGKIIGKKDIKAGEKIYLKDIADITEIRFQNITINDSDSIIYCFKNGWKFGLYFDFNPLVNATFHDYEKLYQDLGSYHKYLTFQSEYAILENQRLFQELFNDGWFPFIRLLGGDYEELAAIYEDKPNSEAGLKRFVKKFDHDRIYKFVNNWWRKEIFKQKREIINSGVESYLQDTQSGFIASIKTLYSEIEGIIRISYFQENNRSPNFGELVEYIGQKAKTKFFSRNSLGFPDVFFTYLKEVIFRDFNLGRGEIDISRHSTSHGVAKVEDYSKMKALQAILVLDQMYYYL